jgi:hypothetical protein
MTQAGKAAFAAPGFASAAVGFVAADSSGRGPIVMSMTPQPWPVHCGQPASTQVLANRNRRSG